MILILLNFLKLVIKNIIIHYITKTKTKLNKKKKKKKKKKIK